MNKLHRFFISAVLVFVTVVSLAFAAHAAGPVFRLEGGGCYFPEETLRVALYVTPGTTDNTGDLYFVLKTPDGDFYSYRRWSEPNVLRPLIPGWTAIPLNAFTVRVRLNTLPTSTVGRYTFLIGMTRPGTLQLTSNVAKMRFYIKKVGQVPSACQCAGDRWSLHTDTFYTNDNPISQVQISMVGTVPLNLVGSAVSGTASGAGPIAYRNVSIVSDCIMDVGGDWISQLDGTYANSQFSLTETIVPGVVTGSITCPEGTVPFPPFIPDPPPDGASKAFTLPMSNGYTTCAPISLSGWSGDSCRTLTCP